MLRNRVLVTEAEDPLACGFSLPDKDAVSESQLGSHPGERFPCPANECGQPTGKLPRSQTDLDDAERDTGNYGSEGRGWSPSERAQLNGPTRPGWGFLVALGATLGATRSSQPPNRARSRLGRRPPVTFQQVTIHILSDGNAGVPAHLRDHIQRRTLSQHQRGARVAQVVRVPVAEPGPLAQPGGQTDAQIILTRPRGVAGLSSGLNRGFPPWSEAGPHFIVGSCSGDRR